MARARDLLEASYELEPDDLTTVTYLGQARLELGDAEGAIPLLALAADTYPQLRPMLQRAELGAAHGQRTADAFLAAERELAQGNAGLVEGVKGAAEVNAAVGRADEARRLWERALQLDPDDAEVAAIIARLDAAAAAQAAAVAAEAAQEALAAAEAEAEAQAAAEAEAPPVVLAPPGGQTPVAAPPAEPLPQEPPVAEDPAGQPPVAEEPAQDPAEEPPVAEEPAQPPVAEEQEPEEPPVAE